MVSISIARIEDTLHPMGLCRVPAELTFSSSEMVLLDLVNRGCLKEARPDMMDKMMALPTANRLADLMGQIRQDRHEYVVLEEGNDCTYFQIFMHACNASVSGRPDPIRIKEGGVILYGPPHYLHLTATQTMESVRDFMQVLYKAPWSCAACPRGGDVMQLCMHCRFLLHTECCVRDRDGPLRCPRCRNILGPDRTQTTTQHTCIKISLDSTPEDVRERLAALPPKTPVCICPDAAFRRAMMVEVIPDSMPARDGQSLDLLRDTWYTHMVHGREDEFYHKYPHVEAYAKASPLLHRMTELSEI